MTDKNHPHENRSTPESPTGQVSRPGSQPFGYVIGNLDPTLRDMLGLPEDCASIGIVSSRDKSSAVIFGADESVK